MRLSDLTTRGATPFSLVPTADERKAIADALGIAGVKKLSFSGQLEPVGKSDWALDAVLGATVVQACVISLIPVTTRIDEGVNRRYMTDLPQVTTGEIEMPQDDTIDPLPAALDLAAVMIEALSLALPQYPKAEGATLGDAVFTEDGITPMSDDDAKPFAELASFRERFEKKEE
ncbi:YceD family protein [Yoonia sp. 2307UL14-13]|uniref:YceD family protein n=1 Tax=Yoonia sp. 2307UL14-13 TaxID=3126506 RepID=UPI0030A385C6